MKREKAAKAKRLKYELAWKRERRSEKTVGDLPPAGGKSPAVPSGAILPAAASLGPKHGIGAAIRKVTEATGEDADDPRSAGSKSSAISNQWHGPPVEIPS